MSAEEEVAILRTENEQLRALLAQALARIAELEAKVGELEQARSENELPPPPPPFIKPATPKKDKTQKQPRRKRAKDQNGSRRRETPTQTIQHKLEQCPTCRYLHPLQHPQLALRRQVIELPPPQPVEVTEHQLYKSWCPRCGKWHYASVDLSTAVIGQSRIGVRIVSLIAYLRTCLRLPVRLIREYLLTVHNLMLSTGQITDLLHRVAEAEPVQEATHQICQRVRHSPIVHGDETVWREEGQNGYVWSFSTPEGERYFQYDKSRAGAVAKRILGSDYKGTLVSDFYAAYNDFPGEHQRCWAHLLRDLHALKEMHKENGEVLEWTAELRKLYDQAQELVRGGQGQPHQPHNSGKLPTPTQLKPQGSWHASTPTPKSMLRTPAIPSLRGCCCTWTACSSSCGFVRQPGLSADNNLAERSVRPVVVMRKVSGGSQSERGSRTRMTLASLFGTWRAKGLNPFSECLLLLSSPSTP